MYRQVRLDLLKKSPKDTILQYANKLFIEDFFKISKVMAKGQRCVLLFAFTRLCLCRRSFGMFISQQQNHYNDKSKTFYHDIHTALVLHRILKIERTHVLTVFWGHLGQYTINFLSIKIFSLANFQMHASITFEFDGGCECW